MNLSLIFGQKTSQRPLLGRPEAQEMTDKRLPWILLAMFLWGGGIMIRLTWLQVINHAKYRKQADSLHIATVEISPVRGDLRDRRNLHLAVSRRVESAGVHPPSFYPDYQPGKNEASIYWGEPNMRLVQNIATKLSPIIDMPKAKIIERLLRKKRFVWVARKLMPTQVEAIKALRIEQVYFFPESLREYPMGSLACQILGFCDIDGKGQLGIERTFDSILAGSEGRLLAPRDAKGRLIIDEENYIKVPVNGSTLQLTIDASIQHIVESAMKEAVDTLHPVGAYAVVVDPNTGEILAIAGTPSFDPNHPLPKKFLNRSEAEMSPAEREEYEAEKKRQAMARRVRPMEDTYEPGSTMKIFTAAMALEERKVHLGEKIDCGAGAWSVNGKTITDSHRIGTVSFEEVLWQSSNIGTAKIGLRLDRQLHYQYLKKFGFGDPTGLNFPGESAGILAPPDKWSGTSQQTICYGYGIATTPLQLIMAGCAIANGGTLMKPILVQKIFNDQGVLLQEIKPQVRQRVISEETSAMMREVLKGVITNGTAKKAALEGGVEAFGKTGTARKQSSGYNANSHYASFMGFFPANHPRFGIMVMIDEPGGGRTGGDVAAPIFKKIGDGILRYQATGQTGNVEPDLRLSLKDWPTSVDDEARVHVQEGKVPDVRGLSLKSALYRIALAGGQARYEGAAPVGAATVAQQHPAPGTPIQPGTAVTLTLR